MLKVFEKLSIKYKNATPNTLVVNTRIFTTILLLTVSSICSYLPCFADYALVKHVFKSFERHRKYGQTTAYYGFYERKKL